MRNLPARHQPQRSPAALLSSICLLVAVHPLNAAPAQKVDTVTRVAGEFSYQDGRVRQGSKFRAAVSIDTLLDLNGQLTHIHPNTVSESGSVPTTLEFTNLRELKGLLVTTPNYPRGGKISVAYAKQPVRAYFGHQRIEFGGQVPADMPLGRYRLQIRLTYQPCTKAGCTTVQSQQIEIPFEVVSPKAPVYWDRLKFYRMRIKDYFLIPVRFGEFTTCVFRSCC